MTPSCNEVSLQTGSSPQSIRASSEDIKIHSSHVKHVFEKARAYQRSKKRLLDPKEPIYFPALAKEAGSAQAATKKLPLSSLQCVNKKRKRRYISSRL